MRLRWLFLLIPLVPACLLKAEGFTGGTPDAGSPDAGVTEGPPDSATAEPLPEASVADAAAEAASASPNLLVNGDFESGCASWVGSSNVTLTEIDVARSGKRACRICMNAVTGTYVYQTVPRQSPPRADRFLFEVWLRAAPGATPTTTNFELFGSFEDEGGEDNSGPSVGAFAGSTTEFRRTSIVLEPWKATKSVSIVLELDNNNGKCAILDDAAMWLLP